MSSVQTWVRRHGGLIATHELHTVGVGRSEIRAAVATGRLLRVRQGWYAAPGEQAELLAAARVGGRASCHTAARARGLWVPEGLEAIHVSVHPDRVQLRSAHSPHRRLDPRDPVRVHWVDGATPRTARSRLIVPVEQMIRDLISCADPEDSFVMIESALHRRVLSGASWSRIRRDLPPRSPIGRAAAFSESGTESMLRFRMLPWRLGTRQQVRLGDDRVDFLIGERLVVEIDSRAHHDAVADRRRDARLGILGFRVVRFGYDMIVSDWPLTEAAIVAALARGDHRD